MPKASTLATTSPATVTALRDVLGVQDVLGTVNIFDDTTAGLAATVDGEYFSVPSADADEYQILYKNETGSATEIKRYPAAAKVASLDTQVGNLGGAVASGAYLGDGQSLPATPAFYRKVMIGDVAYAVPHFIWRDPLDLFVIVGQSNAEGRGDSSLSPSVAKGRYIAGGVISALADPVGGATTGSMWPAFANEWFARTGRWPAFVESATGGTALIPSQAGTNWSPLGSLRAAAVAAASAATTTIAASPAFAPANVYFLWAQGENEAPLVNGTTITGAIYAQALKDLAAYFKAQVPSMVTMGVIRTGNPTPRAAEAGWAEIRAAQDSACADGPYLRMLYRGTASFPNSGLGMMSDGLHYSQAGYNMAGKCAARELAKETPTAVPSAPGYLASQAFTDTTTTTKTDQTRSHTTHANTKMLVVAVSMSRITNNTTTQIGTCTFNGVAMTKAFDIAGSNSSPQGRSHAAVFYLTETTYGAPLGGVTANIVHTPTGSQNTLELAAFDVSAEGLPDNCQAGTRGTGNTGSSVAISLAAGAPGFVVAVSASAADSAAAITHTYTGLTEVMDAGGSNGTRSGQGGAAYGTVTESVGNDFGVTFSATVTTAAHLVVAFRGKIDGE